ncbi:SDR family oxidoreductase [Georgenia alba]|uniref:SDR family oxidoreductase n=1 Tax=Georgenia alba TaxID=2233858 RepID=A0ABW2QAN7_9MICO
MDQPILVTGATGHTGRHVVAGLLAENVPVRALVRDPASAALPAGVDVVVGDLTDADAVARAAEGTAAAYLLWPGFDPTGAAATIAALAARTPRIVYVSASGAPEEPETVWGQVEAAVRSSAREWTFLRVTGLATNTLGWAEQVRSGVVRGPYGGATRSLVHERDVAATAVRALLDDGHDGHAYDVTGPEALPQSEQARLIGEAIGRPVRWEEQPEAEARAQLTVEMGADFAEAGMAAWSAMVDAPEPVSSDVEKVTGRRALTFAEWAREHADDFSTA